MEMVELRHLAYVAKLSGVKSCQPWITNIRYVVSQMGLPISQSLTLLLPLIVPLLLLFSPIIIVGFVHYYYH